MLVIVVSLMTKPPKDAGGERSRIAAKYQRAPLDPSDLITTTHGLEADGIECRFLLPGNGRVPLARAHRCSERKNIPCYSRSSGCYSTCSTVNL